MRSALLILLLICSSAAAQNTLYLATNVNRFFSHSDNELPITARRDWQNGLGFEAAWQRPWSPRITLRLSVGFSQSKVDGASILSIPGGSTPVDLRLSMLPADLSVITVPSGWITFGIGPTLVYSLRTSEYARSSDGSIGPLSDRLAGAGLGAHTFLEALFLPGIDSSFFATLQLRLRYVTALWYQEKGRALRDYDFDYFQGAFVLGLGWKR